jgi:hypothetical protein
MLLILATACAPLVDLPDVPIVGGTEEMRTAARSELEAFDAWVGEDRLQISEVEFKALNRVAGLFRRGPARVLLDDSLSPMDVHVMLRHELCHALDHAEGLLDDKTPSFDEYGDILAEKNVLYAGDGARDRRSEALAHVCETGPLGTVAFATPCTGEPRIGSDLGSWTRSEVWKGFEPPPEGPKLGQPAAGTSYAPSGEWQTFDITSTLEPDRVTLHVGYLDSSAAIEVDVNTGEFASYADSAASSDDPPDGLPPASYELAFGWPDGPGGAVAEFKLPYLLPKALRLLASDGDGWFFVGDGCIAEDEGRWDVFTADGRVWFATGDGTSVEWMPIGE